MITSPVGEDGKRPDGMTIILWEGGHSLLWDFTSCDSVAIVLRGAGMVACNAEGHKRHN